MKKKLVTALLVAVAIVAVLITMHLLVNNFDIVPALKALHGG